MNSHYRLDVSLTLAGPILTRGGQLSQPGIDASLARDAEGRAILPFSLVKGKVLDALRELFPTEFEDDRQDRRYGPKSQRLGDWFGIEPRTGSYEPERARLRFSDFHTNQTGCAEDNIIERVQIDAETGTVANRMLMMIEAPYGYGEHVQFEGRVEFVASDAESREIKRCLRLAFNWIPSFGALRTAGFGRRIEEVALTLTKLQPAVEPISTKPRPKPNTAREGKPKASSLPGTATSFPRLESSVSPAFPAKLTGTTLGLRLCLDRPLCVVGRKHSWNHFESLDYLSGAVVKGAVARLLREVTNGSSNEIRPGLPGFPTLAKHFTQLRFAEARPTLDPQCRPIEPPLTIVVAPSQSGRFYDLAACRAARLIAGESPAFMPDWKGEHFALVRGAFGWPWLPRERRTRTAIEPSRGRAADERLFSYGLVQPEVRNDNGSRKTCDWVGAIGLEEIPVDERKRLVGELHDLLQHGLPHIGKTRATAVVQWLEGPIEGPSWLNPTVSTGFASVDESPTPKRHVVVLQTDFLMNDPDLLCPKGGPSSETSPADRLRESYERFWNEISDGAFALDWYFARQTLHGGFQAARSGRGRYEPYLLTERGSVFVLRVKDSEQAAETAAARLAKWRSAGLPIAKWVEQRFSIPGRQLWQSCPYLPHAGYGEVAIDLPCHFHPFAVTDSMEPTPCYDAGRSVES